MSEFAVAFLVLGLVLVLVATSRRQPLCVVAVQPLQMQQWEPPPEDWPGQLPFA